MRNAGISIWWTDLKIEIRNTPNFLLLDSVSIISVIYGFKLTFFMKCEA